MKYLYLPFFLLCITSSVFSQKIYTHWDVWYQFNNDSTLWYRFEKQHYGGLGDTPHDIRIVLQDDEKNSKRDWEDIEDGVLNIYEQKEGIDSTGKFIFIYDYDWHLGRDIWVPDTTKLRISYTIKNGLLDGVATEYCQWGDTSISKWNQQLISQQYIYSVGRLQEIKKYSCRQEGNPLINEITLKNGRGVEFFNIIKGRQQFKLYNNERIIYDSRYGKYRDGGNRFRHYGTELSEVSSSSESFLKIKKYGTKIYARQLRLTFNKTGRKAFVTEFRYGKDSYIYDFKLKKYKIKERNQYYVNGQLKTEVKYGKRNKVIKKCFDEDGNVVKCN
jgi:hypothetical protein